jgi:cytochrome c553
MTPSSFLDRLRRLHGQRLNWATSLRGMPSNHWLTVSCTAVALTVLSGACLAQKGDLEFGRYLASECLTCHRGGAAGGAIPNIFGIGEAKFTALIKAYRDKQLPNPVMQSVASRLKDDEIDALAQYFSVTKTP